MRLGAALDMQHASLSPTVAAILIGSFVALWFVSVMRRDASIVDVFWGLGFVLIALVCALSGEGFVGRALLVLSLTLVWGLRLGAHLLHRNWGQPEDRRYAAMRRHFGERFWFVSLFSVFLLQAALMWVVSLPLQWAIVSPQPERLTFLDFLGLIVWGVGFLFEAIGDWQLERFRANPANDGEVMDRGLWAYTRHPNYFGDALVWWGLFLIAASTPGGMWTIVGPLVMTTLLLRISGVALLERTIVHRRPAYQDYIDRTSAFIPWRRRTQE